MCDRDAFVVKGEKMEETRGVGGGGGGCFDTLYEVQMCFSEIKISLVECPW